MMSDKYIVVQNDKPQTGPLSLETAERVKSDLGRGAEVVPAGNGMPEKKVNWGSFFFGLVAVGVLMIVLGLIIGLPLSSLLAAYVVVSPLYVALYALLRG